jgi:hypothetical protein
MNDGMRDARFGDERPTRSLLLSLLTEACELEHGLACCYLYAAFSLKKELHEPGMTWERQRLTRMWAAQIFMVAAQEMQHLAEAWNLLIAIGGTAYYGRPPFPQTSKYYQLRRDHSPSLELTAFSRETLDRFVLFEEPDSVAAERQGPLGFDTIGGLYRRAQTLIGELDERSLFVGDPASQVGPALADFPGLSPVTDATSAIAAIERIIDQGEGTRQDRPDSHLGVFRAIRRQLDDANETWADFAPARPVVPNAIQARHAGQAPGATAIENEATARVAEVFDDAYSLMLQLLGAAFTPAMANGARSDFARVGIGLMPTILRPVAETLTQLPFARSGTTTAGPPFSLSRYLPFSGDATAARTVAHERLCALAAACREIPDLSGADFDIPDRLVQWAARLGAPMSTLTGGPAADIRSFETEGSP